MLEYLVTSRVRRRLLIVLWRDGKRGNVSSLARLAGVSFPAAHHELDAMCSAGLALRERQGASLVYRARWGHPDRDLITRLVEAHQREPPQERVDAVAEQLAALGAPFVGDRPDEPAGTAVEETLAEAVSLAHDDGQLAKVLPFVLWLNRQRIDWERLATEVTRRNERPALGLFLEVAGRLAPAPELVRASHRFRDRRRRRLQQFFNRATGRYAAAVARRATPPVARRWGYLMNLPLEMIEAVFRRHAPLLPGQHAAT